MNTERVLNAALAYNAAKQIFEILSNDRKKLQEQLNAIDCVMMEAVRNINIAEITLKEVCCEQNE